MHSMTIKIELLEDTMATKTKKAAKKKAAVKTEAEHKELVVLQTAPEATVEEVLASLPESEAAEIDPMDEVPLLIFNEVSGKFGPNPAHPDYKETVAGSSPSAILAKHSEKAGKKELKTEEQRKKMEEILLSNLNSPEFRMEFFSEEMFKVLVRENKLVNTPVVERTSGYNSLPMVMPFDEKRQQNGFSGKRGRMFYSLCMGKTAGEVIAFETSNRKAENNDRLEPVLFRKTLAAMAKGYFPEIHKVFKDRYPVSIFKPAAVIVTAPIAPAVEPVEATPAA